MGIYTSFAHQSKLLRGIIVKRNYTHKSATIISAVFFIGLGTISLASDQKRNSYQEKEYQPSHWRLKNINNHEGSPANILNPDEIKKLEEERKAFLKVTADLRKGIFEKKLALRDELIKNPPNGDKLKTFRNEISMLESRLNKIRYAFLKRKKKIYSRAGFGFFERGIMGNDTLQY
jgi:hypothetical protein